MLLCYRCVRRLYRGGCGLAYILLLTVLLDTPRGYLTGLYVLESYWKRLFVLRTPFQSGLEFPTSILPRISKDSSLFRTVILYALRAYKPCFVYTTRRVMLG